MKTRCGWWKVKQVCPLNDLFWADFWTKINIAANKHSQTRHAGWSTWQAPTACVKGTSLPATWDKQASRKHDPPLHKPNPRMHICGSEACKYVAVGMRVCVWVCVCGHAYPCRHAHRSFEGGTNGQRLLQSRPADRSPR